MLSDLTSQTIIVWICSTSLITNDVGAKDLIKDRVSPNSHVVGVYYGMFRCPAFREDLIPRLVSLCFPVAGYGMFFMSLHIDIL